MARSLFKEYLLIGGLPAVISSWVNDNSWVKVSRTQQDLLATYRDDFSKYKRRFSLEKLDEVMLAVPKQLGEKFMYSKVDLETTVRSVKDVLSLLERARICSRVSSSAANGIPLAAEIKEKVFKEVFLDVGLCCAALGLVVTQLRPDDKTFLINQGGLAEQVVGQLLRTISPPHIEPSLYYWQRSEGSKNSKVDYVIQHGNQLIPIEVKAGSTGTLKSLHVLMGLRKLPLAVRINADLPTKTEIDFKVHLKK